MLKDHFYTSVRYRHPKSVELDLCRRKVSKYYGWQMSNLFMASSHPRLHCVPKNDTALAWYIVNVHRPILIIFGWNIAKKVSPRMAHFFPPQCFCTTWENWKPKIASFLDRCPWRRRITVCRVVAVVHRFRDDASPVTGARSIAPAPRVCSSHAHSPWNAVNGDIVNDEYQTNARPNLRGILRSLFAETVAVVRSR